ncbi:MAG TPA: phage integrase N-terminal SAM-like domain-containing protein [Methylomirabilota bacterium]
MAHLQPRIPVSYVSVLADSRPRPLLAVRETPHEPPRPRLLDRVRNALSARHYSRRPQRSYVAWIRRYIFFHGKRHPIELGAAEVTRFLTSLAVERRVAASTQNQALSALTPQ